MIIFRCANGWGNKFANLLNAFYLHSIYPKQEILIDWTLNEHFSVPLKEIIDLAPYPWLKLYTNEKIPQLFATTGTKWDNITYWQNKSCLCTAVKLFNFIPYDFCYKIYTGLIFSPPIKAHIQLLITNSNLVNKNIIHIRKGDYYQFLKQFLPDNFPKNVYYTNCNIIEYDRYDKNNFNHLIDRTYQDIIIAIAEFIFYINYTKIKGYTIYSSYSCLMYILNHYNENLTNKFFFNDTQIRLSIDDF